ncbi:tape measure protein [Novosphingobium sp. FGD1]|uniref:Tape measure protein n=2 Tax=Novosphingobium silvae TaxID=2692619 RepID=A0A7X4K799_9SPHN|nr:tape measure protein [Novosphingobium silvae]
MAEIDPVILQLRADVAKYNADMQQTARRVQASLSLQERSILSLENQMRSSSGAIAGSISRIGTSISGLAAGVSLVALAKQFLDVADTAKSLDAQLRLATAGFGTFAQAQEDVRRIAADTRSGLQETASLYGNFSRGAKELGADQEAAARATETFSKTLKVSGADANQSASATLQFGQALAAGALRGDELNSVLEAAPRLARLLTESMGLPIGKIKELGEEGKLTSEVLLNALTNRKYTETIDAEFRELPVTFNDAMTQIENAAIITFGGFDRGGQFSTALANFITDGSDGFKDLEQDAVDMGIAIRSSIEGLVGAFQPILEEAKGFFDYVNGQSANVDLRRDIDKSAGQLDSFLGALAKQESPFEQYINARLYGSPSGKTNFQGRFRQSQSAAQTRLERANGQTPVSRVLGKLSEANRSAGQAPAARSTAASSSDADKRKAAAAARKAENERLRAIREDASNARDAANLQDDINSAKAALAVATEDVLAYNLQAIENEKQQRTAEYETQRKLGRITDQELADRTKAVAEIADLQRQRVQRIADENARRDDLDRFSASVQDNSDLLRAQADLVTTREARRDIELRLLDLSYEQERAEQQAVLNSETASAAQKEIAEQRLRILDQLKSYDVERTNRQYESPLEQRRRQVREDAQNMGDRIEDIEVAAMDRLGDSVANTAAEYVKLGGIAGEVINGIIRDVIRLAAQQALLGGSGGIGGFLGRLGSIVGIGGMSSSGIAAANQTVGSTIANNAALFQDGGYTGDGPANKPAGIVHKGEYVFPADAVRRIGVQNLAAMANSRAASSMAGTSAVRASVAPVQQNITNYYGPGAEEFWGKVDGRAARVATPIAARQANQSAAASYAAGQQSAPGTINKYNQLKG